MFFKKPEKLLYCQNCGVCFKERQDNYGKTHCFEHARGWLESERRAGLVRDWALRNWEKLEPQMLEETRAAREAVHAHQQAGLQAMASTQNFGNQYGGNLQNLFNR